MWRSLVTRAREFPPGRADALLAAVFALAGVLESLLLKSGGHSRPLTAGVSVALALCLVSRRRHTLAAALGFLVVVLINAPLNTFVFSNLTTPFVMVLVLAYTVGRHEEGRRLWLELASIAVVVPITGGVRGPSDALWVGIFILAPALAGRGIRSRSMFQQEMRQKAQRLEAERELRAQRAVEDERGRIASELQAVVANGVSAMVVQAEAVPRLFRTGDRAEAERALAVIEETGRDALAEMRRLLGVLRRDDDGPRLTPQPTLSRADALVARMQAQGLDAALRVEGEPVPLPAGVDLAGYRVLQEALSSAREANGVSHADVSIVYGDANVLVRVGDDRETNGGLDPAVLRALRERLSLYGGALRAAPRPDSHGFEVEVRLPIGGSR